METDGRRKPVPQVLTGDPRKYREFRNPRRTGVILEATGADGGPRESRCKPS